MVLASSNTKGIWMRAPIASETINAAVQQVIAAGNEVVEISEGWSEMAQVVHMRLPLSEAMRELMSTYPTLNHSVVEPTPHNRAEEIFIDRVEKVAVSFPR